MSILPQITSETKWLPLVGFETEYAISEYGHLVNIMTWGVKDADGRKKSRLGKLLSPMIDRFGYLRYDLHARGSFQVSRGVYSTFVGQIPEGLDIDHIDSNKSNNHYSNLQPLTRKENVLKAKENRKNIPRGESFRNSKLTEEKVRQIRDLREYGWTFENIAVEYEVSKPCIIYVCQRKTWSHVK